MAKMNPQRRLTHGKWRKLFSEVSVTRTSGSGDKAFQACVVIGKSMGLRRKKRASGYTTSCMFGRNPREAIKHTLQRAVRQMEKRRGAFVRFR